MVGSGTVTADDPQLTCRLPGLSKRSPVRVVVDRHLAIRCDTRLIADAKQVPTWVMTLPSADRAKRRALIDRGVVVIETNADAEGGIDFAAALARLGERGITRLLVEGGGQLAAALARARLVDALAWVHAPLLIGGDGVPAIAGLDLEVLAHAPRFERLSTETVGGDVLTVLEFRE